MTIKKVFFVSITFLAAFTFLSGCSNDTITNTPVTTAKGVFVLNEGLFNQPASYDYSFIDLSNDSVYGSVYQNSNGGATMNAVPDGLALIGNNLYVCAQGNFGGTGTIYKIDATTNQKIASRDFGRNPYSIALGNNKLCATNIAGSFVSLMDLNLGAVNDSINVGPNPADIVYLNGNYFVAKASYTYENSVAVVNESSGNISKLFFSAPPIGIANSSSQVFISTYFGKKIYILNAAGMAVTDSVSVNISDPAIGILTMGSSNSLYVVAVTDTSFQSSVGKKVYKINLTTKSVDPAFSIIMSGSDDVYGIAYEPNENRLYISNSKTGLSNGEVRVYDSDGNLKKTYLDIKGKFPRRFVFKY